MVSGGQEVGLYLGNPGNEARALITALPVGLLPEWTQIDPKGRIIAKGWRAVLEKVVKSGAAPRRAIERVFKVNLDITGKDSLCPKCRTAGKRVRGEGASGLCRHHDNVRRGALRSK
jgi:hypothetical protein